MSKPLSPSFGSFYDKIKEIIETARSRVYYTANFEMVMAYWDIGYTIVEEEQKGKERAEYGKGLLPNLSNRLTKDYGRGFDESNLRNMRKFYLVYQNRDALRPELSWTHYRILMRIEKKSAREFYNQESIEGNWSTRQLERQVNSHYFERMVMTKESNRSLLKIEAESNKEQLQPVNIIKDPYVLEFLNLNSNRVFYESELEQALIDKLQEFLLELGKGFTFVHRQYHISADTKHFYVDLVFYNYILKCFLLIDLKTGELTHQDIGQMDFYVRYFEDKVRQKSDNPTIGLILCAERNKTVVKYSLLKDSKHIFASRYKLYLPTDNELKDELTRERKLIELEKQLKQ
ncbi:MAG: PDDEXK nuclease domain-containing protein [Bacteroidales bacterium]|nr:PDDEXK nuclease domain-containing protein [Bacteroidales bacterium]